ncbi:PEP-CTERM sorting domain-containing protein [Dapis sp. BLCC M229]|uniref:PEP-CTERM sorting domain-containing protein n=1 Tax=Dapis sp. BLCC M229 TaxID=3400188 RepID=UPI003CEF466E
MKNLTLLSATVLTATSALIFGKIQAASALIWNWSYSAPGIEASGNLTTNDTPDDLGFYLITGITGTRNDETIIGLQPTGTSVPGNEPFELDNLISLNPEQLTSDGFGYFTSEGNFVNMFFADFLQPPGYFEIFSAPPFIPGFENLGPEDSELPVSFSAAPIVVPEPTSTLSFLALGTLGAVSTFKRKLKPSKSKVNPS